MTWQLILWTSISLLQYRVDKLGLNQHALSLARVGDIATKESPLSSISSRVHHSPIDTVGSRAGTTISGLDFLVLSDCPGHIGTMVLKFLLLHSMPIHYLCIYLCSSLWRVNKFPTTKYYHDFVIWHLQVNLVTLRYLCWRYSLTWIFCIHLFLGTLLYLVDNIQINFLIMKLITL